MCFPRTPHSCPQTTLRIVLHRLPNTQVLKPSPLILAITAFNSPLAFAQGCRDQRPPKLPPKRRYMCSRQRAVRTLSKSRQLHRRGQRPMVALWPRISGTLTYTYIYIYTHHTRVVIHIYIYIFRSIYIYIHQIVLASGCHKSLLGVT